MKRRREDEEPTVQERANTLLQAELSRGQLKREAKALDEDAELRQFVLALARSRGADLPDEAGAWPGKRLLRRARDRSGAAQERTNPIALDEGFTCVQCGREVQPHGRTARDHCPWCLHGLHVDDVPGDRSAECGGVLVPIGVDQSDGRWRLRYRCRRCGAERVNQVLRDGDPPDDWKRVTALAGAS